MSVKADVFAKKMTKHWESPPLSNVSSDRLRDAWADMADTFNHHISGKIKGRWSILQLPTGAGKTQGLSLYCSMLPKKDPPGVLIVTNLVEEAKIIEADINRLSQNSKTALLCHAENKREVADLIPSIPVLIITHNAYKMAWEDGERTELYSKWKYGQRKLVVIDEALDIVEGYQVNIDDLRFLRGVIPQYLAKKFSKEIAVIDEGITLITDAIENKDKSTIIRFKNHVSSFDELIAEAKKLSLSFYAPSVISQCNEILRHLKIVSSDWCLYASSGQYYSLGTAKFLLPKAIKHAVVLDATVSENPVSRMLGEKFDIIAMPEAVKRYSNLKLHVSYGHSVGKTYLEKQGEEHFLGVLKTLSGILPKKDRTLLCVHKSNEEHFKNLNQKNYGVAHWYAINGSNAYRDCRAAIIYGLPYLRPDTATNILFAFLLWHHGIEGNAYDEDKLLESAKKYTNDYILRHIIVSIVQAINRIRCRKIIDDRGNCPEADVYLYLSKKENKDGTPSEGAKITNAIKRLMSDVDVREWDAPKPDGKVGDDVFTRNEQKLIAFFDAQPSGIYSYDMVQKATGLSGRDMQRHSPRLSMKQKGKSDLSLRLPQVTYYSRKGPGGDKYFEKV